MQQSYIIIPLITITVALLGAGITGRGMPWYKTLVLPKITPQGWVISLVWNVIFVLTTISAIIVWERVPGGFVKSLTIASFVANAVLNVFWSQVFFGWHMIGFATIVAGLLEGTVLAIMWLVWDVSMVAAMLLAPYAMWVAFATFLNHRIYRLNR